MTKQSHNDATRLDDAQLDDVVGGMIFVKIPNVGGDKSTADSGLTTPEPVNTGLAPSTPSTPTVGAGMTLTVGATKTTTIG